MGTGIDIYANEVVKDSETEKKNGISPITMMGGNTSSMMGGNTSSMMGGNTSSTEGRPFLKTTRVIKELNALGVSTDSLFAAETIKDLIIRSRARGPWRSLGPWMRQVINDNFGEKNPEVVYKLLGRISDLLQLSRWGCKGFACSVPVLSITNKYQDLMYRAARIRYVILKCFAYFSESAENKTFDRFF